MSTIATKDSLAERYSLVLQELRLEVLRHNPSLAVQDPKDMDLLSRDIPSVQEQQVHDLQQVPGLLNQSLSLTTDGVSGDLLHEADQMSAIMMTGGSPNSMIAQFASWGQFDSLVSCFPHIYNPNFLEAFFGP
jgi:hypothetical protein